MSRISIPIISVLTLLFFIQIACNEDQIENALTPPPVNYHPLTTGSYWVYNTYLVDSLQNETLVAVSDTISIIGDSLLNGHNFSIVCGMNMDTNFQKRTFLQRDSAGYILDEEGYINFCQNCLPDTLFFHYTKPDSSIRNFLTIDKYQNVLYLQNFTFDSLIVRKFFLQSDLPSIPDEYSVEHLFAPNVGMVLQQTAWSHDYYTYKKYFEHRLVDYYIAP